MPLNVTYYTATRSVDEITNRHMRFDELAECCRQCPRYGSTWKCPPWDYDPQERLKSYKQITLLMARIEVPQGVKNETAHELLRPVRQHIHQTLLKDEANRDASFALLLAGSCDHCDTPCARLSGESCRHPELVRPSLEGWGIDVTSIAREIFNTEIEWGTNGYLPPQLILMAALLHKSASPQIV